MSTQRNLLVNLPLSALTSACLLGLCSTAHAAPTLPSQHWVIPENTASNTQLGQLAAEQGAATKQLQLAVGKLSTQQWLTNNGSYESVQYATPFSSVPTLVSQIQSTGNYSVAYRVDTYSYKGWQSKKGYEILFRPRHANSTATGFDAILETDIDMKGSSVVEEFGTIGGDETIGWLAIDNGNQGLWSGVPFETINTEQTVTQDTSTVNFSGPFASAPNLFSSMTTTNGTDQAGVGISKINSGNSKVFVDELDDGDHNAEALSMLMLQGSGSLLASDGQQIGVVGSVTIADGDRNSPRTINLNHSFQNPVVFVQMVGISESLYDSTFRFTNISSSSFSGYLHYEKESTSPSKYSDFTLQYVVLEAGNWQVDLHNYQYAITAGNDDSAFKIDPNTGVVSVDKSSALDYESGKTQYNLTVTATDGSGQVASSTVTVDLTNVADSLNSDAQALHGINNDDRLGYGAASAGDVNGDGFDDVIFGAPQHDTNGSNAGAAYVLFGNATGKLASINEASQGIGGFAIYGEKAGDGAGFAVAGGGDINGDGLADVVIGAPYADYNGDDAGKVYVVFGKADSINVELSEIALDSNAGGFVMYGRSTWNHAGGSLAVADFNADGLADIRIGEVVRKSTSPGWGFSSQTYAAPNINYTVFGKADGAAIALADIVADTDTRGYAVVQSNRKTNSSDFYGSQALPLGDINSDGLADSVFNLGIFGETNGYNYVQLGSANFASPTKTDAIANGITIKPESANYGFNWVYKGTSTANTLPSFITSAIGDINGDGIDDLALLATDANCCGNLSLPQAYVVYGQTGDRSEIDLSQVGQGIGGFVIQNDFSNVSYSLTDIIFGAIGGVGDVNGDGFDDLMIGDQYADAGNGRFFVVYGKADQTPVLLSDVANGNGGTSSAGNGADGLGHWLGRAGDINGDGIADMFVSGPMADPDGVSNAGTVYVLLGNGAAITQWASAGQDNITLSDASVNNLSAGSGDDFIVKSSQADSIFAGPGNDVITIKDGNIQRIDGGQGEDTLRFEGAGLVIDLASQGARVRSIEQIDIRGSGANKIAFNKNISSTGSVLVQGDADDTVYSTNQQWVDSGASTVIDGVKYQVYNAGSATLYLQTGVAISTNNPPTVTSQNYTVNEYIPGGTVIGTVLADANDEGDSVSFAIADGNSRGLFSIDASTGELRLADHVGRLDYESGASHTLTIVVTDKFTATGQGQVVINVNNLSEMTHSVSMDASGGSSIWGDWGSLANLLGESWSAGYSAHVDLSGQSIDTPVLDLTADGTAGVDISYTVEGGQINATLPVEFSVTYPDEVQPGQAFNLTTSFAYGDGAGFTVSSPYLAVDGKLWLKDYYFHLGTSLPSKFDSYVSKFNGDLSGSYAATTKTIETNSHSATGTQVAGEPLKFTAEINDSAWVDEEIAYPSKWDVLDFKLQNSIEKCEDGFFAPAGEDLSFRMEYSMMEAYLALTTRLNQKFTVELKPAATLILEDGSEIAFDPQQSVQITPQLSNDVNGDGVIDATLRIALNSTFTNDTDIINSARVPFTTGFVKYNIQEALCTATNTYLYGKDGLVYEVESEGPLLSGELKADIGWDGQTDMVPNTYTFELNDIVYTEKLSFDLCDGEGTACAAPIEPDNTAPVASNVSISGYAKTGVTLNGAYQYSDENSDNESGSSYQWYLASNSSGTGATAISNASAVDYAVQVSDEGQYLQFCVTPSDGKDQGDTQCSAWLSVNSLDADLAAGFGDAVAFTVAGQQYGRLPMSGAFNPTSHDFTIETWVNLTNYGNYGNVLLVQQMNGSGTGRSILGVYPNGHFFSYLGGSKLEGSTVAQKGQWHHVAVSYQVATRTLSLYVDGKFEAKSTRSLESCAGDLLLGVNKNLNGNFVDGALDEFRVWQSVRSVEQLAQHRGLAVDANSTDLLAYYSFNGDDGITMTDASGKYPGNYSNNPSLTSSMTTVSLVATNSDGVGVFSGVLPITGSGELVIDVEPQFGTVSLNSYTGEFSYSPVVTGQAVSDSFSYYVKDGAGHYGQSQTVTITLTTP